MSSEHLAGLTADAATFGTFDEHQSLDDNASMPKQEIDYGMLQLAKRDLLADRFREEVVRIVAANALAAATEAREEKVQPRRDAVARFEALQNWEGTVVEVTDSDLTARLHDQSSESTKEDLATISLEEVSGPDLPLVRVGAVFYWVIGYRILYRGQKELVSSIRFRRLPAWTDADIRRARRSGARFDELMRSVRDEDGRSDFQQG